MSSTFHFRPLLSFPETGLLLLINKLSIVRRSLITDGLSAAYVLKGDIIYPLRTRSKLRLKRTDSTSPNHPHQHVKVQTTQRASPERLAAGVREAVVPAARQQHQGQHPQFGARHYGDAGWNKEVGGGEPAANGDLRSADMRCWGRGKQQRGKAAGSGGNPLHEPEEKCVCASTEGTTQRYKLARLQRFTINFDQSMTHLNPAITVWRISILKKHFTALSSLRMIQRKNILSLILEQLHYCLAVTHLLFSKMATNVKYNVKC